jgi:cytochrome c oxidase cbb3-type subunit 3
MKPGLRRWSAAFCATAALAGLSACDRSQGGSTQVAAQHAGVDSNVIGNLPLGDVAGAAISKLAPSINNPYESNPQAIASGHELFVLMNCAGCHGYDAKGGMGPNLTDTYWRYGGVPADVFKSIYEGRPQGMPAWNPALPPDDIWKLVAYIESLGGTFPANAYQASLQGDRPGDNFPPEVVNTLSAGSKQASSGSSSNATSSPPEARPDAGGKP